MTLRTARVLTGLYFILMAVAVTWPGMVPFSRIRPMVLGLPFSFFWGAAWVGGALVVLWLADRVEARYRDEEDA
jgi:hypothetical protein